MSRRIVNKPKRVKPRKSDFEELIKRIPIGPQNMVAPPTRGVPVSVCMIVKNCRDSLDRCLKSLKGGFLRPGDEIVVVDTGSTDDTPDVAKRHGARVLYRSELRQDMGAYVKQWLPELYEKYDGEKQFAKGCIMDFAGARQIATDAAKHDAIFWIDSDDQFREERPGTFRQIVDTHWKECDAFFLDYMYAFDQANGAVTTVLKRERVVDRRNYHWVGRCHETLVPRPGVRLRGAGMWPDLHAAIFHTDGRTDHELSDIRNYCIIRRELEEANLAGAQPDVRSVFYLGNACRGLKRHAEAIGLYQRTLALSGSRDDRYSAAYYQAMIYLAPDVRRVLDALDMGFQCLKIKPKDPRGHYLLARCYALLGRHEESLYWFRAGRLLPEPKETLHSYDPEHIHRLPYVVAVQAARELEQEDLVKQLMGELFAARGDHPDTKALADDTRNWLLGRELVRSIKAVSTQIAQGDKSKTLRAARELVAKLPAIPPELERMGVGKIEPADTRPLAIEEATYTNEAGELVRESRGTRRDVAIMCGYTHEAWGPANAKTGIGGSEKAVIQMAPRLQKRGFNVTVYANVPTEQRGPAEDGVVWRHFAEFDETRDRDIVIFWRSPEALESPIRAKKRIVWLHDVQTPEKWTPARCALADQVWVLSEYHATTLGAEARARLGDKLVITRNGIDADLYRKAAAREGRRIHKVLYCSSPDRGVMTAIAAFQQAFADDPDAELHVAYGFNKHYLEHAKQVEYAGVPDLNRDCNLYDYMSQFYRACDEDPRIKYHGRLDWERLAQLQADSDIWLYPTRFPEISCMAAMEAQAAGCKVVATDFAALAETIDWTRAIKVTPETAAEGLLKARATELDRAALSQWARDKYCYDCLAQEWRALLLK